MKLSDLNLGEALSKDAQKRIRGGEDPCPAGYCVTDCHCTGVMVNLYVLSHGGGKTPWQICNDWCVTFYGVSATTATQCVAGGCGE